MDAMIFNKLCSTPISLDSTSEGPPNVLCQMSSSGVGKFKLLLEIFKQNERDHKTPKSRFATLPISISNRLKLKYHCIHYVVATQKDF
jgi:hypothetical protein